MNSSTLVQLLVAGIIFGTPMVFASMGEILAEKSGVLNIGIEGLLLVGAVAAFWGARETNSVFLAIVIAIVAASLLALLHAFAVVTLGVNQILLGLGIVIFGGGISSYIAASGNDPLAGKRAVVVLNPIVEDGMADWPFVGPVLLGHNALVYLSWLSVIATTIYLQWTRSGLVVRAVGSDPASADAVGINVGRVRYVHVVLGGVGAGLGGAYYALVLVPAWQDGLTAGAGWIVLAIVIVSQWQPWRALLAAVLFGAATRLGFVLQLKGIDIPTEFLGMIPFIGAGLAVVTTKAFQHGIGNEPESLGLPYDREYR